jgi:hypothetical protein
VNRERITIAQRPDRAPARRAVVIGFFLFLSVIARQDLEAPGLYHFRPPAPSVLHLIRWVGLVLTRRWVCTSAGGGHST